MGPEIEEGGLDMDAAVGEIGASLGFENEEAPEQEPEPQVAEAITPEPEPVVRTPPKSWSKEKHDLWTKLPPEAQEQVELREKQMLEGLDMYKADSGLGKSMREAVTPYRALLASQGVDEVKAVQVLMNAHYKLSTLGPSERNAYFASLAQTYGVDLAQAQTTPAQQVDPQVKALQERLEKFETAMSQQQRTAYDSHRAKVSTEVETFAKEHPYFDEVADDIITFINAGLSLQEAHDRAVWANPVTRAKETARLQDEASKKLREKATKEGKAARQASSANVRSRDTSRAPTELLGTMEDTMKETLAAIKSGSTH